MAQEAKVKLTLDTDQAKAELRELSKLAAGVGGGIGGAAQKSSLAGFGGGLVGGALGSVLGSLKSSLAGSFGDVIGAATGPLSASLQTALFQGADIDAKASELARAQLPLQALGRGSLSLEAGVRIQENLKRPILHTLQGARMVESDPRFFRSPTPRPFTGTIAAPGDPTAFGEPVGGLTPTGFAEMGRILRDMARELKRGGGR